MKDKRINLLTVSYLISYCLSGIALYSLYCLPIIINFMLIIFIIILLYKIKVYVRNKLSINLSLDNKTNFSILTVIVLMTPNCLIFMIIMITLWNKNILPSKKYNLFAGNEYILNNLDNNVLWKRNYNYLVLENKECELSEKTEDNFLGEKIAQTGTGVLRIIDKHIELGFLQDIAVSWNCEQPKWGTEIVTGLRRGTSALHSLSRPVTLNARLIMTNHIDSPIIANCVLLMDAIYPEHVGKNNFHNVKGRVKSKTFRILFIPIKYSKLIGEYHRCINLFFYLSFIFGLMPIIYINIINWSIEST